MAQMSYTAANISADWEQGSVVRNYVQGEAIDIGEAVYLGTDGLVYLADANGASEAVARAIGICVALPNMYGETTGAASDYCSICVLGPVYGFSDIPEGTTGWTGTTAGQIVDTAPAANAYQFAIGYAAADDTFFVNPESDAATSV
jgi:hypothetical protein